MVIILLSEHKAYARFTDRRRSILLGLVFLGMRLKGDIGTMRLFKVVTVAAIAALSCASVALASDLPNKKAPPAFVPPPPPIFTWTGLYIGGQLGYEWGHSSTTIGYPVSLGLPANNPSGVVGGAHIGYNYQTGQFVVGIEGDVNGSSYKGTNTVFGLSYGTHMPVDGSIRARVGIAWDRALIYATGGAAFGDIVNTYGNGFAGVQDVLSKTRVGWTVGGGVEYAIDNNWSVRAEYRYTDFGNYSEISPVVIGAAFPVTKKETDNRVQAGFSYKFDLLTPATPVVAKY